MILDDLPEQLWGQEGRSQPQLWFGENHHGSGSSKAGTGWSICFEDEESTRQGNCLMHIKDTDRDPVLNTRPDWRGEGAARDAADPRSFGGRGNLSQWALHRLCDSSPRPAGWG